MSINIDLGVWNSIFAVPSKVVDEGLKFSDGVKLKVLLFVLRNAGSSFDESEISKLDNLVVTKRWINSTRKNKDFELFYMTFNKLI